jgi:carboxyl-terminal processing protease
MPAYVSKYLNRLRLSALLILAVLLQAAALAAPSDQDQLYEQIRQNIGLFGDVYREVSMKYVDTINPEEFVKAGIEGMLSTLDPYTVYIEGEGAEDLDMITNGKYGGVGIEIGIRGRDKVLTVISAMDDSPAQRVGIRSGDRIIAIDGEPTTGFTTNDAAKHLRGDPGSQVKLLIERTGSTEPIEFDITRREISIKDVAYSGFARPGVGYVRLSHFSRRAPEELDIALNDLKAGGLQSLILDLRGNPGGLLNSAVGVVQRFCAKGEIVLTTRGRSADANRSYKLPSEPLAGSFPLAVLIDGGSASASEIVSGAIQDLDRGVIIGETTFGKGLVQSIVSFETGEALKITTAKYYTPSGRLIQKVDYFQDKQTIVVSPKGEKQDTAFTTRNGRPVQGGGGIMPDIRIPAPAPGPMGVELWRQGSFFDYMTEYRAQHPNITDAELSDDDLEEFHEWLDRIKFSYDVDGQSELRKLQQLISDAGLADSAVAEFQHIEQMLSVLRDQDFEKEKEFIRQSLEAEIANSLWGSRGRIESSFSHDKQILKALEVLSNKQEYDRALAVANEDTKSR